MVSIIIPTCAASGYHRDLHRDAARQDQRITNYEIICIDNIPAARWPGRSGCRRTPTSVVDIPDSLQLVALQQPRRAASPTGEFLLFLNDDIEITQDRLARRAAGARAAAGGRRRRAAAAVSATARCSTPACSSPRIGIGRHAFRFADDDDPGYFGLALTQRNVIAVTGACMLVRRAMFDALGGFDEAHEIVNNDLDFCLRAHQRRAC